MLYRPLMIPLKRKHLIKSITGLLIIPKSDRTKRHQILAINRITKLNITRKYLKLRKRYRKVIIRHFIKDMLLTKRFQLMITLSSLFCSSKSSIRKTLIEDRIWQLLRSHSGPHSSIRYNIPQYYPEHSEVFLRLSYPDR